MDEAADETIEQTSGGTESPTSAPQARQDDRSAIRSVFEAYRKALLSKDGEAAASLVDSTTTDTFQQIVHDALSLSRRDTERLDATHKFMVLRIRHQFDRSQLEDMNGPSLLAYGVDRGWISRTETLNARLGEVDVEGNRARAKVAGHADAPAVFYFAREKGEWRISLWRMMILADALLERGAKEAGLTETEYVLGLIEAVSESRMDRRIVDGPRE